MACDNTTQFPDGFSTKAVPEGADKVMISDSSNSDTTVVAELSTLSSAINYNFALSGDADNLLEVDGSNKLKADADNFVSADGGNSLTVGTDDKLFVSAGSLSLTEDRMLIGGVGSVPEEKTSEEVNDFLGQFELPINHTLDYISNTTVRWSGEARSDDNTNNLIGSNIDIILGGVPSINTTYYGFIYSNAGVVNGAWDTDINGSNLPANDFKRLVYAQRTDGVGDFDAVNIITEQNTVYVFPQISLTNITSLTEVITQYDIPIVPVLPVIDVLIRGRISINDTRSRQILLYSDLSGNCRQDIACTNGLYNAAASSDFGCNSYTALNGVVYASLSTQFQVDSGFIDMINYNFKV